MGGQIRAGVGNSLNHTCHCDDLSQWPESINILRYRHCNRLQKQTGGIQFLISTCIKSMSYDRRQHGVEASKCWTQGLEV